MANARELRRVCVFCGSRPGLRSGYVDAAARLGALLAARKIGLVYGGSRLGVMGSVAEGVLAAGGEVLGVIPHGLADKEIAHDGLSQLFVVDTMHARKAMMADLADGFIALPGGFGTLDELFEIITWAQIGLHAKPVGLLNAEGFFEPLRAMMAHVVAEGFADAAETAPILFDADPASLLDGMQALTPRILPKKKWVSDRER